MKRSAALLLVAGLLPFLVAATPDNPRESTLVEAMEDELDRTMNELVFEDFSKPYFASLSVFEVDQKSCEAQDGGLLEERRYQRRWLRVEIRVGDYQFDNGNAEFQTQLFGSSPDIGRLTVDDDYHAIRRDIWALTDGTYKQAVEFLGKKRAVLGSLTESDDEEIPSFTKVEPIEHVSDKEVPDVSQADCADLVRSVSSAYGEHPEIETGKASAVARTVERYYLNSEGTFVYEPQSDAYVEAWGRAVAPDGMPVKHFFDHVRRDFENLPSKESLVEEAKRSAELIADLRDAETVESYTGPVLFTKDAATQLMWQLLADEFSGTPSPLTDADQTGTDYNPVISRMNRRILPKEFDVFDDPTMQKLGDIPLIGAYEVDHEGVPAERVDLVKDGMLQTLLMSRTPREDIRESNGHARGGWHGVEATVGNLIFQAENGQTQKALEQRLLAEAKKDGLDHAYIVHQFDNPWVTRDSLTSGPAWQLGAQNRMATTVVERIHADGSREYVRGLTLQKPLIRDLEHIVAWSDEPHITNYISTGATGYLQSIATPSLLFEELDMPGGSGRYPRPRILPPPTAE